MSLWRVNLGMFRLDVTVVHSWGKPSSSFDPRNLRVPNFGARRVKSWSAEPLANVLLAACDNLFALTTAGLGSAFRSDPAPEETDNQQPSMRQ